MIFVDRAALEAALIGRRTYDVCTGITGGTVNDLDGKDVSSMPENTIFVVLRGSVKLEYVLYHSANTSTCLSLSCLLTMRQSTGAWRPWP